MYTLLSCIFWSCNNIFKYKNINENSNTTPGKIKKKEKLKMIFYYEQNKWFYTTCILYILTFLVRDNIHK